MKQQQGQCLCGTVRFTATGAPGVGLCHCKMCRRWTGGLPWSIMQATVEIDAGADAVSWWRSSEWNQRGFCTRCGTPLFARSTEGNEPHWAVSVGALEDDNDIHIAQHIFIDDKAAFYELADDAPRYTGVQFTASIFAMLKSGQDGEATFPDILAKARNHFGDAFVDEVEKLMAENTAKQEQQ